MRTLSRNARVVNGPSDTVGTMACQGGSDAKGQAVEKRVHETPEQLTALLVIRNVRRATRPREHDSPILMVTLLDSKENCVINLDSALYISVATQLRVKANRHSSIRHATARLLEVESANWTMSELIV